MDVPILTFDIETIPDIRGLRQLYALNTDVSDEQVAEIAFQRRRQQTEQAFLPLHLQRVVAISCALHHGEHFQVWTLAGTEEAEIIQRFFDGITRYTPQLVSWNGNGFDLPVLHYRGLVHGIQAPRYWDMNGEFKWNNYISRYHWRHLDLMDILALYQARASVPLDELAKLAGFPGKLGLSGDAVWGAWCRGEQQQIYDYCETDVVNTHLLFLRFELQRGTLNPSQYQHALSTIRVALNKRASQYPHWQAFLTAWPSTT